MKEVKLLIVGYLVLTTLAIYILLMMPNQYFSKGLYAPSEEIMGSGMGSLSGSLGGLANLAGLDLGGGQRDNLQVSLEIMKSKEFIYQVIEENDLSVSVFAAKNWDPIGNKLSIDPKLYNETERKWVRDVKPPKTVIPSKFELYDKFKSSLTVSLDKKTRLVTVRYKHVSPLFAQQVVDLLVDGINEKIKQKELLESTSSIDALNNVIENTKNSELKSVLYQLIQEQTKRFLIAKTKEHYVLEPIDRPIVEENKHSPKRAIILIVYTFIYGLFSILFLLFRIRTQKEYDI